MGEIAEMMLDGTLCQHCGTFISATPAGYPRTCRACHVEQSKEAQENSPRAKVRCDVCGKMVKRIGLEQHKRDAHGKAGA